MSRNTHPLGLILLSAAALAVAFVSFMLHQALAAFLGRSGAVAPLQERRREILEKEKALVLRSIKELEFDRAMGKIDEADFDQIGSRLRARALTLMQDLERADRSEDASRASARLRSRSTVCATCGTPNDADARFCKQCGRAVERDE
jgi:hypothetical protein